MPLSPQQIAEMDRASGLSSGQTQRGGILDTIKDTASSIVSPIARYGKTAAGASFEGSRAVRSFLGDKNAYVNQETGETVQNPYLSEGELSAFDSRKGSGTQNVISQLATPGSGSRQMLKDTANVASYAIPAGKGASVVSRAMVPGAVSGALQAASQENATPWSVFGGGTIGALTAGAASKVSGGFSALSRKVAPEVAEEAGKVGTGSITSSLTPVETIETVSKQFKSPKDLQRKAQEILTDHFIIPTKRAAKIKPLEVMQELLKHGIPENADFDALRTVTDGLTGDTGAITRATRQAISSIPGEVTLLGSEKGGSNIVNEAVRKVLSTAHDIPKEIRPDILREIVDMVDTAQGSTIDTYNPQTLYDVLRALEKKAVASDSKSTYLTKNFQAEAIADVYRAAADKIRSSLEKTVAKEDILSQVKTPELIEEVRAISPRAAKQLEEAVTFSEIRSIARPFVRLGEMMELTDAAQQTAFQNLGRKFENIGETFGSTMGPLGRVAGRVADTLEGANVGRKIGYKIEDTKPAREQIKKTAGSIATLARKGISKVADTASKATDQRNPLLRSFVGQVTKNR